MKLLTILLCSLTVLQISAQTFDAVLALYWPAGHCEYLEGLNRGRKCDPILLNSWNRRRFTIRGLWAQYKSNFHFGRLNLEAAKPLTQQLNLYWPARSQAFSNPLRPSFGEQYRLWILEWKRYGSAFGSAYIDLSGEAGLRTSSPARNLQIQKLFFSETLRLYKKYQNDGLGLRTLPATRTALATALGLKNDSSLYIRCLPSKNVQEIRICLRFSFDKINKKLVETEIPCRYKSYCRSSSILLKDFK